MSNALRTLFLSKTFWVALAGMAGAVGEYLSGNIGLPALLAALWAAVQMITLRHAIAKKPPTGGSQA